MAGAGPCRTLALLLALLLPLLAACGDLPQPFRGRPGGDAARLALPLALRLAVPPPHQAMLDDAQARVLADSLAEALQAQDVPAVATDMPWTLDWRVEVLAERQGDVVRPTFRLLNADRQAQATTNGTAVPAEAWGSGAPEVMRQVAVQAAPALARLLLQVDAARKAIDPETLAGIGPPRIRFGGVRGAPGDGNSALAAQMRGFLANKGFVVQDAADGATYGLDATVLVTPPEGGKQRVEIVWIVSRRDGQDLGRVAQLNEVPAGRLNGFWGDIAYAAAEEAADGVRTVVTNAVNSGREPPPASAAPAEPARAPLAAPQGNALPAPTTAAAATAAQPILRAPPPPRR